MPELTLRFLNQAEMVALEREYPNARGGLDGGLFISHSGRDLARIRRDVLPVVDELYDTRVFLHSQGSGGSDAYKSLVELALHFCPQFLLVISQHAAGSAWVAAEVEWALARHRAIACCRFDDTPSTLIHPGLRGEGPVAALQLDVSEGQRMLRNQLAAGMRRWDLGRG
jgi:hypothetical protein